MSFKFLQILKFYVRRLLCIFLGRLLGGLLKKEFFARRYVLILPIYRFFHNHVDGFIILSLSSIKYVLSMERGSPSISITDTGTVQLYVNNKLFLFPGGQHSSLGLKANYENWLFIRRSPLASIVDYEFMLFELEGYFYYQCEVLFPWQHDDSELKAALKALSSFSACTQDALRYVNRGKDLALRLFKTDFEFVLNVDFLQRFKFRSSYMHGDLTPNNILSNSKGELVLIDLERFSCGGWDGFDNIHYRVEFAAATENKNWLSVVEREFSKSLEVDEGECYSYCYYFLHRIAFEVGMDENISYRYRRLATMLAQRILENIWRLENGNR